MLSMSDGEGDAEPLWLGLDLSTQSLTGAVLRGEGVGGEFNEPIVLESVNYEVSVKRRLSVSLCFSEVVHGTEICASIGF